MNRISDFLRKSLYGLLIGLYGAVLFTSCRTPQYIPIETGTTVHIVDSVAIHYLDSIRIFEATRYRDMGWLGDTLRIEGQRSRMYAVADTLKECLIGSLEEDKVEEKTRIVYKDKIIVKDSIRYEEKPVPVEVEKTVRYVPKFYRIFSIIGVFLTAVLGVFGYLKLKGSGLFSKIVNLFKK